MSKMFNWPVVAELHLREDVEYRFSQLHQKVSQGSPLDSDEYWDLDYIIEGTKNLLSSLEEIRVANSRLEKGEE